MYNTFAEEEKAFVVTCNHSTGDGYNYYVPTDDAFLIARNTQGLALVMCGKKRYRFLDGKPVLSIVKADPATIKQGESYEGCNKG